MNEFDMFLLNILNVIDSNNVQEEKERGCDVDEVENMRSDKQCGTYQH